jgi:trehalose-6-phosphatase
MEKSVTTTKTFGNIPDLGLAAEHGMFISWPTSKSRRGAWETWFRFDRTPVARYNRSTEVPAARTKTHKDTDNFFLSRIDDGS